MIQQEQVLPRSLRYCLLATKVGTILDNYVEPMQLSTRERVSLEAAKSFLQSAAEGRRATQALEISERALEAADAYGEAMQATIRLVNDGANLPKELDKVFKDLALVMESLASTGAAPKDRVRLARDFFRELRGVTLGQASGPIEKVTVWER